MYAYLNRNSPISENKDLDQVWDLLLELSELSSQLKDVYDIEAVKIPTDFQFIIIGSMSIDEIEQLDEEVFDIDKRFLLSDFLGNRVRDDISEIDEAVQIEIDSKNAWVEINFEGQPDYLLTGAFLLRRPVISFNIHPYIVEQLSGELHLNYGHKIVKRNGRLVNLANRAMINNHMEYLIDLKRKIHFRNAQWNPYVNPIWNDKTKELLETINFYNSKDSKISNLLHCGKLVAELNSWVEDIELSKNNSNSGQIRSIFRSSGASRTYYLSIDVKNPKGTFELHDWDGTHEGQISFEDGSFIPRDGDEKGKDKTGKHNIKLEK